MAIPFVGLIVGAIFGASLVLTGLTDPDRIIGSLRLKDFHALRTVIVSVLVAMLGSWLLGLYGAAYPDIKPAAILTVLIGGAFVGIGLGLTGFSPGTGLACAASGRIDALVTVIGMFFGAHVYILIYPSVVPRIEKVLNFGPVSLPQVTGTPQIVWIAPVFAAGLVALVLTRKHGRALPRGMPYGRTEALTGTPARDALRQDRPVSVRVPVSVSPCPLEAAGVFRTWKNLLFVVTILSLVCLQAIFWLTNTGQVEISRDAGSGINTGQTTNEANPSAPATIQTPGPALPRLLPFDLTFKHVASVIRPVNAILVLSCVLYSLATYMALSVSIRGRLGGLTHISRAFYFSVVALILLLPWQLVLAPIGVGTIYTPRELADASTTIASGTFESALFYLRFTGTWAAVCLVLVLAQWRSFRWTRAVLLKHDDAGRHIG